MNDAACVPRQDPLQLFGVCMFNDVTLCFKVFSQVAVSVHSVQ